MLFDSVRGRPKNFYAAHAPRLILHATQDSWTSVSPATAPRVLAPSSIAFYWARTTTISGQKDIEGGSGHTPRVVNDFALTLIGSRSFIYAFFS